MKFIIIFKVVANMTVSKKIIETKNALHTTRYWQKRGTSAKINISNSNNFCAKMNIGTSNSPASPMPKPLAAILANLPAKLNRQILSVL